MVTKFRTVFKARRSSERFLALFRSSKNPLSAYASGVRVDEAPLFHVYQAGCQELASQVMDDSDVDESFLARLRAAGKISPTQMNGVQLSMERAAGEGVQKLESSMTLLATAVSGAPFLGLLGTVWGVMDTFVGVAAAEAGAGLASMAPGVSSSLVTTVVALLVAIPAMFGYNFLAHSIKSTVVELDNFSAEFCGMLERHYVDHGRRAAGVAPVVETPRNRATRSSGHTLMLDRPSGGNRRMENSRRSDGKPSQPAEPVQPSLLDHVGDLDMASPAASEKGGGARRHVEQKPPREIRPPGLPVRTEVERPRATLEIVADPPANEAKVEAFEPMPERSYSSVADIIAEEKKKGAGLLLRTLRRAPRRREPRPAEL